MVWCVVVVSLLLLSMKITSTSFPISLNRIPIHWHSDTVRFFRYSAVVVAMVVVAMVVVAT